MDGFFYLGVGIAVCTVVWFGWAIVSAVLDKGPRPNDPDSVTYKYRKPDA